MNTLPSPILLWLILLGCLPLQARESPHASHAAQDADGRLWVVPTDGDAVSSTDGKQWRPVLIPELRNAKPRLFSLGKEGPRYLFWETEDRTCGVSLHHESKNTFFKHLPIAPPPSDAHFAPLVDREGGIWITWDLGKLHRLAPDGTLTTHPIPEGQYHIPTNANPSSLSNPVYPLETEDGTLWFWGHNQISNAPSLKGILVYSKGQWVAMPDFAPGSGIKALVIKDAKTLWAGTHKGLFTIDTATREATPIPEPETGAFREVSSLFKGGSHWFLVSRPVGKDFSGHTLWRQTGDEWHQVTGRFESGHLDYNAQRPIFEQDGHLLIAGPSNPLWVIPPEGDAYSLDWRYRFGYAHIAYLFTLKEGEYWLSGNGRSEVIPLSFPLQPEPTPQITAHAFERKFGDPRGHFWIVPDSGARTLKALPIREWDGTRWNEHFLPDGSSSYDYQLIHPDQEGRIWFLNNREGRSSYCFFPEEGRWQSFPTTREALLSGLETSLEWFELTPHHADLYAAYDRATRQMAYLDTNVLHYFDGKQWHQWKRQQIVQGHFGITQVPWFDTEGRLHFQINDDVWQLTSDHQWESVETPANRKIPNRFYLPEWWPTKFNAQTFKADNKEGVWVVSEGRLLRGAKKRVVSYVPESPHPFNTLSPYLGQPWVAKGGHLFIGEGAFLYQIAPAFPIPEPQISVDITRDQAQTHLRFTADDIMEWEWRLNDTPWEVAPTGEVCLLGLSPGEYRVEVRALNHELNTGSTAANFAITAEAASQLALLLRTLGDQDYDRRVLAVHGLARQPDVKAIRQRLDHELSKTTNDDTRWWLMAAAQALRKP